MSKADQKKEIESYRAKRGVFSIVDVPPLQYLSDAMFQAALAAASAKVDSQSLAKLWLEELNEGQCVQTLHIGSFADEGPVLETMHEQFIPENGLKMRGRHHEIYFSDFRKTPPEKLRTILRQPVSKA